MHRRHVLAGGAAIAAVAATGTGWAAIADRPVPQSSPLIERRIPSTGESIPVIGLGTSGPFEVGADEADRAPLREVLETFFAGGGRLIDTSPMYSTAEEVLGDLLTPEMQQKAFMATKVWTDGERAGAEQIARSAQLLGRERLDLVQVHNLRDLDTHLKTLRGLKEQGKVRYIGVTHFIAQAHDELVRVIERERLDFVQINYSAVSRGVETTVLPAAAERGVAVLINRAFEDGKIFARLGGRAVPPWAAEFGAETWGQLLLKFVIANPAVTCVIPATGKVRHMLDNLGGGRGELPNATQRQQIVEAVTA